MKYLFVILFSLGYIFSYAGGCAPTTTNGTCPNNVTLVPGAACITGTTCNGGAQSASSCLFAGSQCSWYSFVATAPDMFVNIAVTATSGCHISSNVYRSTGSCVGTEVSCQAGTPLDDLHSLTGLIVGDLYYVQVCYAPGGPCGNGGSAQYCISVGIPTPPCDACATPCGTASGFPSNPTVQQVVDACQTTPFVPELAAGSINTFCYDFRATATSVNFNVIITSNCGGGNVTNFSWELYNATCGAPILTGTLASLTFSPLTIGNDYVFCYTFTVPAACTHSRHCPYFVGATVLLSMDLKSFKAINTGNSVKLDWELAGPISEQDQFVVERSSNSIDFEPIALLNASPELDRYSVNDANPLPNLSYYRLKIMAANGDVSYSNIISVTRDDFIPREGLFIHNAYPQPSKGVLTLDFESGSSDKVSIRIINNLGQPVLYKQVVVKKQSYQSLQIDLNDLSPGTYTLILEDPATKLTQQKRVVIQ